ncbi:MAG: NADH:ubiquinone oxidoreductase subunit N, partial [Gammaproteobacteria bacterium]|nr:NADH:ubiquinone oxidoreductase subunit N [Gammaproteobacteria bacterium]
MSFDAQNIGLASTEIFLLCAICVVLLVDLFVSQQRRIITYWLALASIAGSFAYAWSMGLGPAALAFNGSFVLDGMATVLKLATCIVVALAFIYSRTYMQTRELFKGEFYVLGLFGMLGMFVMISAHSLLTIYLGLEIMSLALYAMVAFDRESPVAAEAAMKYFVLG